MRCMRFGMGDVKYYDRVRRPPGAWVGKFVIVLGFCMNAVADDLKGTYYKDNQDGNWTRLDKNPDGIGLPSIHNGVAAPVVPLSAPLNGVTFLRSWWNHAY